MKPLKTSILTLALCGLSGLTAGAWAQSYPQGTFNPDGYLISSDGRAVRDSQGQCVRTSSWTPMSFHPDCNVMPPQVITEGPIINRPVDPQPPVPPYVAPVNLSQTVNFNFDSSHISAAEGEKLLALIRDMQSIGGNYTVVIDGHTDPVGTEAYNMKLSQRRADSVASFIRNQGLDVSGYTLNAWGETELKVDCPARKGMRECNRENRRVEIRVNR